MRSLVKRKQNAILSIQRTDTGSYVNGRFVAGALDPFDAIASVQQATPNEIKLLPEGRRDSETITVYTEIELRATDQGPNQTKGDVFVYLNKTWEVHKVENWTTHKKLKHFKSIAVKQDDQEGSDRG